MVPIRTAFGAFRGNTRYHRVAIHQHFLIVCLGIPRAQSTACVRLIVDEEYHSLELMSSQRIYLLCQARQWSSCRHRPQYMRETLSDEFIHQTKKRCVCVCPCFHVSRSGSLHGPLTTPVTHITRKIATRSGMVVTGDQLCVEFYLCHSFVRMCVFTLHQVCFVILLWFGKYLCHH